MEEGLLGLILTLQKLNVIDKQDVYVSVGRLELNGFVILNCVDEVVCELFA